MDHTPFAELAASECQASLTAAALMGMNNVWYPFVQAAAKMIGQPEKANTDF
jgi:hypothetical protein